MSDRLAISATLSALMMSLYVLFGSDVPRVPIGISKLETPLNRDALLTSSGTTMPGPLGDPGLLRD